MSAGKHVSRISAESRTPDGVQPARAIKMVPEIEVVPVRRGRRDQSLRGAGKLRSNLVETRSEQDCRSLRVLCVQQNRRSYSIVKSLRQDSICKHVKELGALHVAESDVGEMFLPGRSAKLGSAFSELPGAVVDLRSGWDLASAAGRQECWKTLHAERPQLVIGSPPSRRHSPWIKDEREARIQGIKHLNFCCAVYRWQTERGVHFLHEHPW